MSTVAAVYQAVNELAAGLSGRQSPPREEGWLRQKEKAAKPPQRSSRARSASATARSLKKGHSQKQFP